MDEILEIIQRKVLKGAHLPVKIKEIQAGYLCSPYFKDLYLSCSKLVISVTEHLVEVVDKHSTAAVGFFRSKRILKCKLLYGVI